MRLRTKARGFSLFQRLSTFPDQASDRSLLGDHQTALRLGPLQPAGRAARLPVRRSALRLLRSGFGQLGRSGSARTRALRRRPRLVRRGEVRPFRGKSGPGRSRPGSRSGPGVKRRLRSRERTLEPDHDGRSFRLQHVDELSFLVQRFSAGTRP